MQITPATIIQVRDVELACECPPEDVLRILPELHANPYLTESSKALLMALAGATFAEKGVIIAFNEDLSQISMYVDVREGRVVVKL